MTEMMARYVRAMNAVDPLHGDDESDAAAEARAELDASFQALPEAEKEALRRDNRIVAIPTVTADGMVLWVGDPKGYPNRSAAFCAAAAWVARMAGTVLTGTRHLAIITEEVPAAILQQGHKP